MKKKLALVSMALLTICGAGLALWQSNFALPVGPDLQDMLGQPKTAMRLHLYPATAGDDRSLSSGYDLNAVDGSTKVLTRNETVSGGVEEVYHRADESNEWSREYFPPHYGKAAVLRSTAWFAADGKTYIAHEVKHEDGTWERHGQLLTDGKYQQTYYCKDGRTIEKQQLFDKDKRFLSEDAIFCNTGKNVRAMADGEYGAKLLTLFNVDGKPTAKLTKQDNYESVNYAGDALDSNGQVTLHFQHDYGMHGTYTVIQTFQNGRLYLEWNGYDAYNMTLKVYDTSDDQKRVRFQQSLKSKSYPFKDGQLTQVTEYGADGKTVVRSIEFNADGVPTRINMPSADNSKTLINSLDAQGKNIVKSVLHVTGQKDDQEQTLPSKTGVTLPEEFTAKYTHADEPKWDDGSTDVGTRLYDFR